MLAEGTMAQYCIECKFAGSVSGSQVYCNKHQTWMPKYGSCSDYIYKGYYRRVVLPLLTLLLCKLGL
jgi:hypothetical protein